MNGGAHLHGGRRKSADATTLRDPGITPGESRGEPPRQSDRSGSQGSAGWEITGVQFRYPASPRPAIADVTATIEAGRFTALIGPNGSGKSTLIRLLLGAGKPEAGEIRFGGRPLNEWSRRDLARTIGVVPQNEEITFPLTVRELASMGRYPHLGPLQAPRPGDRATVDRALDQCDVLAFADRPFQSLSGGERQRARLARALAQEPSVLALDEPTLALDIGHEMRIFELARSFADTGSTVLLATHNLNLAARFADRMLLLADGRLLADGPPDTVLRRDLLETAYEWPLLTTAYPGPGPDTGAVQVVAVRSEKE